MAVLQLLRTIFRMYTEVRKLISKGVLAYAEPVNTKGLNLLSAPGNDLVAATACAASGAQMVLFTTGRGTPFASPVPTVKIATNSRLAGNKGTGLTSMQEELLQMTFLLKMQPRNYSSLY